MWCFILRCIDENIHLISNNVCHSLPLIATYGMWLLSLISDICSASVTTLWYNNTWLFDVSSLCRRIWRYCISKILVRFTLLSVCLRLIQFPQLSFIQYMRLCIFGAHIALMMTVGTRVLYLEIIIKSEAWPICHCLGLGHETTVCAVWLPIFLWLVY